MSNLEIFSAVSPGDEEEDLSLLWSNKKPADGSEDSEDTRISDSQPVVEVKLIIDHRLNEIEEG